MNAILQRLKDDNDVAQINLNEENRAVIEKMFKYMDLGKMGALDRELVRRDVIAMVQEAQERGGDISSVTGWDYRQWCDTVCESAGAAGMQEHLLTMLRFLCGVESYITLLLYAPLILEGNGLRPVGMTGLQFLLMAGLVPAIRLVEIYAVPPLTFRPWARGILYGVGTAVLLALLVLVEIPVLNTVLFSVVPVWLAATFLCGYLAACWGYGALIRKQAHMRDLQY